MNHFFALARPFLEAGALTHAEVEAVALVAPRFHETNVEALLGLAFVAAAPRLGHVVISLPDAPRLWAAAARTGYARSARETDRESLSEDEDSAALPWPSDLAAWHATTLASSLVGARKPFVAVPHSSGVPRLATHRRDAEEHAVATLMLARAARPQTPPAAIDELLHGLFGADAHGEAANAVRLASANSLAIVTGGPGTGKTFSITRLLAALALSETEKDPLVVRLAAPTGKAAARMGEAIAEGLRSVELPNPLRERLGSLKAETIHRLVGLRPNGTVRHNAANPLRASLVVVDEASMVDLSLMRTLLHALPDHARLVLLGDPDQLASVEAGAVLGDLVRSPLLAPCRMHFTTSRRFGTAPTLAACAHALQTRDDAGDAQTVQTVQTAQMAQTSRAVAYLMGKAHAAGETEFERLRWLGEACGARGFVNREQLDALVAPYRTTFLATLRALSDSPSESDLVGVLESLDEYRVLAVHRRGPLSVATLEAAMERELLGPVDADTGREGRLRHGLAVLVTANDAESNLANGDVGIALRINGVLTCIFAGDSASQVRRVAPARMPSFDGAFAMTIHKSQGSQFRHVAMVLAGRPSPIQTRELVYTALTRAKESVRWVGSERELELALATRTERVSSLGTRLSPALFTS